MKKPITTTLLTSLALACAGAAMAAGDGISVQSAADGSVELSNLQSSDAGNPANAADAAPQDSGAADPHAGATANPDPTQGTAAVDADASQAPPDADQASADTSQSTTDTAATPDVNPREFLRNARDAQWANRLALIRAGMAAAAAEKRAAAGGH